MKKMYIVFASLVITISLIATNLPQQELLKQICSYNGRKTFLLSYPRSGNTWMRYCLEYLTGRPTIHKPFLKNNNPIGWDVGFEVDCSKPPIEKVHKKEEVDQSPCDYENDLLILMIRNPKEAISRQESAKITPELFAKNSPFYSPRTFFDNIALYDSWKPENRLLIYYEDLLTNLQETLLKVLLFLNEPLDRLDSFMKEYELHKKKAVEIYKKHQGKSETEGNDLLFHSKLINADHRKQIDAWIAQLHPIIWQKYLKERYAEENLNY